MNYSQKSFCILNSDPTFCKNPMWHFYGHKSTLKVLALLYKLIMPVSYLFSGSICLICHSSTFLLWSLGHLVHTELLILWITMMLSFLSTEVSI